MPRGSQQVKAYSFTADDRGWKLTTPAGVVIAEPGQQVYVYIRERWEVERELAEATKTKADK